MQYSGGGAGSTGSIFCAVFLKWIFLAAGLLSADVPTADLSHTRTQPSERVFWVEKKRIEPADISYFSSEKEKPFKTQGKGAQWKDF